MGTTAELSQVGQSCAHARLEARQGLPVGPPTYRPRPQPRCPRLGAGRMKDLLGPRAQDGHHPHSGASTMLNRAIAGCTNPSAATGSALAGRARAIPPAQMDGRRLNYSFCQQQSHCNYGRLSWRQGGMAGGCISS